MFSRYATGLLVLLLVGHLLRCCLRFAALQPHILSHNSKHTTGEIATLCWVVQVCNMCFHISDTVLVIHLLPFLE